MPASPKPPGRPEDDLFTANPWYEWGPYLAERAWGTVREDYSDNGDAWDFFPHDHARSRAYRWNEDGMAGISDIHHELCLALALWNGADPILKERMFGLTGPQGNHGEDVKEYWWYLDGLPSHAWLRWRYHYPQAAFPYQDLIDENGRRGFDDPEFELLDTGVFDDGRYWIVDVSYAKASPTEVLARITVENHGPESASLDVLPTLWFRNTWRWSNRTTCPRCPSTATRSPSSTSGWPATGSKLRPRPTVPSPRRCSATTRPTPPACSVSRRSRPTRRTGSTTTWSPAPRRSTRNAAGRRPRGGTSSPCPAGGRVELRLRLHRPDAAADPAAGRWSGRSFDDVVHGAERDADEFYAAIAPADIEPNGCGSCGSPARGWSGASRCTRTGSTVARRRPGRTAAAARTPTRPERRLAAPGLLRRAGHARPVGVPVVRRVGPGVPQRSSWAHLDPAFAKYQLLVLLREWFQHPNGALPAYEWSFDDVNPPVHALAAIRVFVIDGGTDLDFLERVFQKLLLNFTWWLNRQDPDGNNLFGGGFLGLDNISPIDRSHLPPGMRLEQADGTAWMAYYSVAMLTLAITLAERDDVYEDMVVKFVEQSVLIMDALEASGCYDTDDGFFYDRLIDGTGTARPIRVQTLVGVIPALPGRHRPDRATRSASGGCASGSPDDAADQGRHEIAAWRVRGTGGSRQLAAVRRPTGPAGPDLRHPVRRGRVPVTARAAVALQAPHAPPTTFPACPTRPSSTNRRSRAPRCTAETRTGADRCGSRSTTWSSGRCCSTTSSSAPTSPSSTRPDRANSHTLREIAGDLADRLVGIWLPDPDGRRPVYGGVERFQTDPAWKDNLLFFEYFHGDNGAGLGAMHQTGWTALVADLIIDPPGTSRPMTPEM